MFIEICVDGMDSALAAVRGGADRLELCSHLPAGGVTPSPGLLMQCKEKIKIPVHVMIRPRAGDFLYSDEEFETMKADVALVKQMGFDGVVFGILTARGGVDLLRIKELVSLAKPMKITFHRAFDVCAEPLRGLEDLISSGIDCILTSGQKAKALEGVDFLTDLISKAGNRIEIMPGSGIDDQNIVAIAEQTGASVFHLSAKKRMPGKMEFKDKNLSMGSEKDSDSILFIADEQLIRKIKLLAL